MFHHLSKLSWSGSQRVCFFAELLCTQAGQNTSPMQGLGHPLHPPEHSRSNVYAVPRMADIFIVDFNPRLATVYNCATQGPLIQYYYI